MPACRNSAVWCRPIPSSVTAWSAPRIPPGREISGDPMSEPHVQWTAPSPLWEATVNATDPAVRQMFGQPAILRFASDTFMDEFLTVLDNDPAQLTGLVAQPETWRGPTPPASSTSLLAPTAPLSSRARMLQRFRRVAERAQNRVTLPVPAKAPLKLYQSAHQRYYLV